MQVRYVLDSAGDPVAQDKGGSRSYYVDDPRGNLTQQLDQGQNVVAVYAYDAYGGERKAHTKAPSNWASRLRYQMAPHDAATGAYNLGPRLFDPGVNRFVGADSFVGAAANMGLALDPLTGNRYLYAGANPAGLIDDGHGWRDLAKEWGKKVWKAGKALLKNPLVRAAAVIVICWGSAWLGCMVIASAALAGANYLANSKTLTVGGLAKAVVGEGATAAAGGAAGKVAAKLAAEAAAAAAAAATAAAIRFARGVAASRASSAAARAVDDAGGAVAKAVHGNSRQSEKLTYLYRLEDDAGNYLLTGITSNPQGRYSKAYMSDKTMRFLTQGSRSDMLDYERMIVEMDPGPLNLERWAGSAG